MHVHQIYLYFKKVSVGMRELVSEIGFESSPMFACARYNQLLSRHEWIHYSSQELPRV